MLRSSYFLYRSVNLENIRAVGQALFKAIAHLGAASPEASEEVIDLLCGHLAEIRTSLHGGNEDEMGELLKCSLIRRLLLMMSIFSYGHRPPFKLPRLCAFYPARADLGSFPRQALDR